MVTLSRIYTRTGDKGMTSLGNGRRVRKDHPRIEACGAVDETNAVLGLVLLVGIEPESADLLRAVQNDLFDLGADLCVPGGSGQERKGPGSRQRLRITTDHVNPLEAAIDRFNASLPALKSFVLPGGSPASSWLHLARTVCRRAERATITLSRRERINPHVIAYLNRLSDLLFVLARRANAEDVGDVLWVPGGGASRR